MIAGAASVPFLSCDTIQNKRESKTCVLNGCEDIAKLNNEIIGGSFDGKIITETGKVVANTASIPVAQNVPKEIAQNPDEAHRILEITVTPDSQKIYAIAPHKGIIEIEKNETNLILDLNDFPNFKFLNNLVLSPEGNILFTNSSQIWRRPSYLEILEDCDNSGGVFCFNLKNKKIQEISGGKGLYFPNGIAMNNQNDILVAEGHRGCIWKIKQNNLNCREIFTRLDFYVDNLQMQKINDAETLIAAGFAPTHPIEKITRYSRGDFFKYFLREFSFNCVAPFIRGEPKSSVILIDPVSGKIQKIHKTDWPKVSSALIENKKLILGTLK